MATTYWDYIDVERLLALQGGLDDDETSLSNHEVVFITVHQVFELWFKLVLRELVSLRDLFAAPRVPEDGLATAARSLDRIRRIFAVANDHWTVVESLNTRDYLDFRDKLFPASGFQSAQMREIEVLLGLDEVDRVGLGGEGRWRVALENPDGSPSPGLRRVEARLADRPTLREAVEAWLSRTPIRGSKPGDPNDDDTVDAFVGDYLAALEGVVRHVVAERLDARHTEAERRSIGARYDKEIEAAHLWLRPDDRRRRRIRAAILFLESYRELPLLAWPREVIERLVEAEQAMLIFRQRHARMVERIIGRRVGTGGSSGVSYLDDTALRYRVFQDLWAARTYLVPKEALPPSPTPRTTTSAEADGQPPMKLISTRSSGGVPSVRASE